MGAIGGTHAMICLGIGSYWWIHQWVKITKVNCFKAWFQNIHYTFESLGFGWRWKDLGVVVSIN